MTIHKPQVPPIGYIRCMCVGDIFTLTEEEQTFELYQVNGLGTMHFVWIAELTSMGPKADLLFDTGYNVFNIMTVKSDKSVTEIFNGYPCPQDTWFKVRAFGEVGQQVEAKLYLQIGE